MPRWGTILAGALLVVGGATAAVAKTPLSSNRWLEGAEGYEQALEKQQRTRRPIWLYVYTDWCPSCRRMNNELLNTAVIASALPNVLPVALNPEAGQRENDIAVSMGVQAYPSFYVIAAGSSQPRKVSPSNKSTLLSPDEFLKACRDAARP